MFVVQTAHTNAGFPVDQDPERGRDTPETGGIQAPENGAEDTRQKGREKKKQEHGPKKSQRPRPLQAGMPTCASGVSPDSFPHG
jgi:hypothetical protein